MRLVVLGCLGLAGCSTDLDSPKYPEGLRYPARTDLIIKKALESELRQLPPPGDLDQAIRDSYLTKDGKVKDPSSAADPAQLAEKERAALNAALLELFGTPRYPTIEPGEPNPRKSEKEQAAAEEDRKLYNDSLNQQVARVGQEAIDNLQLDVANLNRGSVLYRKHCLHCHGVAGDGRGPTGPWVHPHPRDYRSGLFKFISTGLSIPGRKPRRTDLYRTIEKGIEGTSMPAFGLLPAQELQDLVSYVMHLSLRGQVESQAIDDAINEASKLPDGDIRKYAYQLSATFLVQWADSTRSEPNKPPAYTAPGTTGELHASIRRGQKLFIGKGICITCHHDYCRQSPYKYDLWGTLVRPRDLTQNTYRGGRRPLDIYWRFGSGIVPSGMPALESTNPQDFWDLVNFVQNLPYPAMLPDDVYQKVYGAADKKPQVAHAQ